MSNINIMASDDRDDVDDPTFDLTIDCGQRRVCIDFLTLTWSAIELDVKEVRRGGLDGLVDIVDWVSEGVS